MLGGSYPVFLRESLSPNHSTAELPLLIVSMSSPTF
jgi:hypothetical protein